MINTNPSRTQALTREALPETAAAYRLEAGVSVVVAVLFGFFLLLGAGFVQTTHDVAHDTRHSLGFPCH